MRYDTFVRKIEQARNRYEAEVRRLVLATAKADTDTETKLLASLPGTGKRGPYKKKRKYTKRVVTE